MHPVSQLQPLLDTYHSSFFGGHAGITRLSSHLKTYFYFPHMYKYIAHYVASCTICQRVNSPNSHAGSLQPTAKSPGRWKKISMDIVSGFTKVPYQGQTVDSVLVIIDLFSSHAHFFPIPATFSAADFSRLLLTRYMPLHGIPSVIHTDRGRQFENDLIRHLTHNLHSSIAFSITGHHQSNGKVECFIRTLQDYLRSYVGSNTSWFELLAFAEFTINSTPSVSLAGNTPFQVDLGYNPSSPASLSYSLNEGWRKADDITELLDRYGSTAKAALNAAHERNKQYYDFRYKDVEFELGDTVYIDQTAIPAIGDVHNKEQPASHRTKFIGPFRITQKLSPVNYELELPPSYKRSPIFHISQLRKQHSLPDGFFRASAQPAAQFRKYKDGSVEMEITAITDHKKRAKGYLMLVKFSDNISEWIRMSSLKRTAGEMLREYCSKHSDLRKVFS